MERLLREVERDRHAAGQARAHYEAMLAESDEERRRRLAQAAEEARRLLVETQRRLDEAIHQVRRQGITPVLEPSKTLVRQAEEALERVTAQSAPPERDRPPLSVGEPVWLPKWRVRGVVLKWPESGDLVEVQAGQMTIKVPLTQVEPLHRHNPPQTARPASLSTAHAHASRETATELNLIGWRVSDALPHLDKYLDEAVAAGLQRVRIIHGKGSGRLRAAVHELLTSHPQVKTYMPCGLNEGGWGATLVEINA
jgi:DNA mismatch repair protein MutS2